MPNEDEKIRITADEVDRVVIPPVPQAAPPPPIAGQGAVRQWGRVDSTRPTFVATRGSLWLKAWVYLAVAGLLGGFVAWALCEPSFQDFGPQQIGNFLIFPAFGVLVSVGFALAESIVERSWRKAAVRCILAIVLGVVLAFVFDVISNAIYRVGLKALFDSGHHLRKENPLVWCIRAIAWSVFGVTGGIIYGIAGRSAKKCGYGVIGGMLGAAVGGILFDPISIVTGIAGPSRCLGLMIMGAATGAAIGLVESALKDRWLYVSGGPLAGKQFVLYKPETRIGSDQSSDIYLFKDASISPQHALIALHGGRATLRALAATYISGQPVMEKALQNGDLIQIGRYSFNYQEKQRT